MWQAIVKAVLGGIGGGMSEAGKTGTNTSGYGFTNDTNQLPESNNTGKGIGDLAGKAMNMLGNKKDSGSESKTETAKTAVSATGAAK